MWHLKKNAIQVALRSCSSAECQERAVKVLEEKYKTKPMSTNI
jgi:hypothetical protein